MKKILIVDSYASAREYIAQELVEKGYLYEKE